MAKGRKADQASWPADRSRPSVSARSRGAGTRRLRGRRRPVRVARRHGGDVRKDLISLEVRACSAELTAAPFP